MRDREGFQQLLTTLQAMKIEYTIQEITEQQYNLAQRVRCRKATPTTNQTKHSPTSSSTTYVPEMKSQYEPHKHRNTNTHATEEEDDIVSKIFTFPTELLYDASGGINTTASDQQDTNGDSSSISYTDTLLHTAKENFVFLTFG